MAYTLNHWRLLAASAHASWPRSGRPAALPKEEVQRRLNEFKAKQAKKMANLPKNEVPPASGKTVIVVGGGLAGMSAAIGIKEAFTFTLQHAVLLTYRGICQQRLFVRVLASM